MIYRYGNFPIPGTNVSFIKLVKGEATEELLKHPREMMLLTLIAYRAKRTDGFSAKGLRVGDALVGDYKSCGLSRQSYRTALKNLEKWQFLTIKPTKKGTVATLLNTSVFDINIEKPVQEINQQVTNSQPTGNQQVTTNKKEDLCFNVFGVSSKTTKKVRKIKRVIDVPDCLKTEKFVLVWGEFKEHRKKIKKPMTDLAEKKMLARLSEKNIETAIAMLNRSIENGWQGIFELQGSNGRQSESIETIMKWEPKT